MKKFDLNENVKYIGNDKYIPKNTKGVITKYITTYKGDHLYELYEVKFNGINNHWQVWCFELELVEDKLKHSSQLVCMVNGTPRTISDNRHMDHYLVSIEGRPIVFLHGNFRQVSEPYEIKDNYVRYSESSSYNNIFKQQKVKDQTKDIINEVTKKLNCSNCEDKGWVCEDHPGAPWNGGEPTCGCGGAGMMCPICSSEMKKEDKMSKHINFSAFSQEDWEGLLNKKLVHSSMDKRFQYFQVSGVNWNDYILMGHKIDRETRDSICQEYAKFYLLTAGKIFDNGWCYYEEKKESISSIKQCLYNDCLFEVIEKARKEGKGSIEFADVDALVLEKARKITEYEIDDRPPPTEIPPEGDTLGDALKKGKE